MMENVSPLTTSGAALKRSSTDANKANLDYSAFLRLFIASMKNQDPTKPNDPTQTMAQLASFSNVEQSIKLNEKLDALLATTNASLAAAITGKTLSSLDGKVTGKVVSVDTTATSLIATLDSGRQLNLADGYRIQSP